MNEKLSTTRRDPMVWLTYLLIAGGIVLFCLAHTQRWVHGLGFAAGLGVAFGLLAGVAKLIVMMARKIVPASFPYVWRQGLANLYRPNNRTVLLMLSLGLGTFLILTLYLTQDNLLNQLVSARQSDKANVVLFDIQADQKAAVAETVQAQELKVLDEAPVVTMRLLSIKGRRVEAWLNDTNKSIPNWVLRREYRSTYSDQLRGGEKILSGQWVPRVTNGTEVVPISLEQGIAEELQVELGDNITFDVQGIPIASRVASLRQVDWRRVQPNFFVIFPRGVLENAPAFHVLTTRVESPAKSAALQRAVVQKFPNVSSIDLTLILQTLDSILSKVSFVIRFMALFTVITGLLVLAGAILTGRFQRIRESILLRTLGASRRQIMEILVTEYLCLGALAALTGIVLAVAGSWALATFIFDVTFVPSVLPLVTALVIVSALTVFIGLLTSRGILNDSPLAVLRSEA